MIVEPPPHSWPCVSLVQVLEPAETAALSRFDPEVTQGLCCQVSGVEQSLRTVSL